MTKEEIVISWISEIETITVEEMTRKLKIKRKNLSNTISLNLEISDLQNDAFEDIDYKSKNYSKWSYILINLFIEKFKIDDGYMINNSNWTTLDFYDSNNKSYAIVDYRIFDLDIRIEFDKFILINRERKLKNLGI